jgi:hypothetical protein
VESGAGEYPGNPEAVGRVVATWVREGEAGLARRAARARQIAQPEAAFSVAEEVWKWANTPRIANDRRNLLSRIEEIRSNLTP